MTVLLPASIFIPFFVASIAIELTPGPNMAYLALLSLQRGRGAGLLAVLGVALGLLIIGLLATFGVAALVAENHVLYEILRWLGVGFLIWLAYDSWKESRLPLDAADKVQNGWSYFTRGMITNLLNPKAFLFYVSMLPSFADEAKAFWPQALQLTLIYVAAATLVHFTLVMGAGGISRFFERPAFRRILGNIFAALLVCVAIWLAANTAQKLV